MKKFFMFFGGFTLMFIIIATTYLGYLHHEGRKLDITSKAYIDTNIPVILSTWSMDELLKRSGDELWQHLDKNEVNVFFLKMKQLGKMQKYEGSEGESSTDVSVENGKVITARYTASAIFQNGTAQMKVKLTLKHGQWQIGDFEVSSPILAK